MGERAWVRDLVPGTEVRQPFAVRAKDVRRRRGGGEFLTLVLSDRTGHVDALAWEGVHRFDRACRTGDVVRVVGHVQKYRQRLQIVVRDLDRVADEEIDEGVFIRSSAVDPERLRERLDDLIASVDDEHLRDLLARIVSDPEVAGALLRAPAARSLHHAYRGGLLEHTVSMTTAAAALCDQYGCDRSLVVAGCVLHDLGKVWELDGKASFDYTDDGRLLGHIPMIALHVDRRIAESPSFPEETRRQLLHVLLAHHGEYAYGSPRRPKMPEALLVHTIDNLDARMAAMFEAISSGGDTGEAWSAYSPILERPVYRRRPGGRQERGDG